MAVDFPNSPSLNQSFVAAGVTFIWNGTGWVASGAAYLPLTGGTLTGNLTITTANWPAFTLNKTAANGAVSNALYGSTSGKSRWEMDLGDSSGEYGGNGGSNFGLNSFDDTGAYLDTPFSVTRGTGQALFSRIPSFPGGTNGQVLATNGAGVLSWATPGGSSFANKLRNGTFDVWQRGTIGIPVPNAGTAYIADGWIGYVTGAAQTVGATTNSGYAGGANPPKCWYGMITFGVAGISGSGIVQRIESFVSAPLGGVSITFQAKIYNQTGATFTPQLQVGHATAQDNFGAVATDLAATNLQPCPNAAWTTVAYTLMVPVASAQLGLWVQLIYGTAPNASGKNIVIAEADLRATPGWPVGLCANPPPPELRPIATEMAFCQRYFFRGVVAGAWYSPATYSIWQAGYFPALMRAAPAFTNLVNNSANITGQALSSLNIPNGVNVGGTATATGTVVVNLQYDASAEL